MSLEEFLNLPAPKQKDILRVALHEFSTYGYDLASTNRIVVQAGISKGVLFKYFTSKEGLFLYIIDKAQLTSESMESLSHFSDIFDYLECMIQKESEAIINDSDAMLFFFLTNKMILEPNHPVYAKALSRFLASIKRIIDDYCDGMDISRLKEGLSISDLKKVLHFLLDSIRMAANQNPDKMMKDPHGAMQDIKMLLSIVKAGVFKEMAPD
jgi:TetR/AcrR family transcriptional regulator